MSFRNRVTALVAVLGVLSGTAVLVTASPVSATPLEITVTSSADAPGTCPSPTDCTLRQALADFSSGGINENSDAIITITDAIDTISLSYLVEYNGGAGGAHTLVLNGNGVSLDGNETNSIFFTNTTGSVEFNDFTFTNGDGVVGGAIASAFGPIIVNNSTFSNNHGVDSGGAIYSINAIQVTNSTFLYNSAGEYGGAISGTDSVELSNVTFTGNTAGEGGGAVAAFASLTVSGGTFLNNEAESAYGGALFSFSEADITNATFTGNSAALSGGAIGSLTLTLSNSTFTNNSAGQAGGATYTANEIQASNSSFTGNSSNTSGGAMVGSTIDLDSTAFINNSASIDAGAVFGNALTISESSFDGNSAGQNFGAVFATSLLIVQSSLTNNTAEGVAGAFASAGTTSIIDSTIANNSGATTVYVDGSLTIVYSTISGNAVTGDAVVPVLLSEDLSLFGTVLDAKNSSHPLCAVAAVSTGYNFADDTSCGLTSIGDTQGEGLDPMLGTLANHGGESLTRLPLAASPLVGAIPNALCDAGTTPGVTVDQRGYSRPNAIGGPCDIGAVQLSPQVSAVVEGSSVTVTVSEFTSTATITLYSEPLVLGTIQVDATGSGSRTFDIDCSVEIGAHTITASADGGQTASTTIRLDACALPRFTG